MMRYASPRALEQAAKDAARKSLRDTGRALEGFYLDRFLCRIFSEPTPSFVLKGGQSQLARRADARETRDTDLVGTAAEIDEALKKLKELASVDLGDFLEFVFVRAVPIPVSQKYRTGLRVEFRPVLGRTKRLNSIHIDLVVDRTPPQDWVTVTPAGRLEVEGLSVFNYALQTVEERIADKVCATMQLYDGRPSSRVKDLVDLAVSMLTDNVDADMLVGKVARESALREMAPVRRFEIPEEWRVLRVKAYAKSAEACAVLGLPSDIEMAEQMVARWLDPVLDGSARGLVWHPDEQSWR